MYYQKTFDAMMSTPLSLEEIITGEIFWGATKSVIASTIMLAVISAFGLISYPEGILIVPLAFLGGLAFGSVEMLFTGIVANIDQFNLPIFFLVTPMFLFSGTFFPLDTLPGWARHLALALPLTHLVEIVRSLSFGEFRPAQAGNFAYLACFTFIFFFGAVL
jgi:lipooligosaccharide transport system permease protein